MIHYARVEESPRLQRVLALLSDGRWHSTRNIIHGADVCCVNTCIAEMRRNNIDIETRCVGRGRYEYRRVQPAGQMELAGVVQK